MKSFKIHPQSSTTEEDSVLEKVPHFQPAAANPLKLFPARSESFTRAIFGVDAAKNMRDLEGKKRWKKHDSLDPNFGTMTIAKAEDESARTFRRMHSSPMFSIPKQDDSTLRDLYAYKDGMRKKFVMVEESRLAELSKFESTLRHEQNILHGQTAWVLSDFQVDPRIPVPATRIAIHNICENEMRKIAAEIHKLNENWDKICRDNHYNRPHVFTKETFLHQAPLGQRALKMKLIKESMDSLRIRQERDTMQYEDDLSYFLGKYADVQNRKRDYDRYYTLSIRYGIFSEKEYFADSQPGKRYFMKVLRAALLFQRLWDRYWAVAKLRRYRAARRMQRRWRFYIARKKYYPIIRIRLRVGKRSYLFFCWYRWQEYLRMCRNIKESLAWHLHSYVQVCFKAWKERTRAEKARKNEIRLRFIMRVRNARIAGLFLAWARFAKRSKEVKRNVRRLIQLPQFGFWVTYTKESKARKRLHNAATVINALVKGYVHKRRFENMKEGVKKLYNFAMIVLSVRYTRLLRRRAIAAEFSIWGPQEKQRRLTRLQENEFRRQGILAQLMKDRENRSAVEMKKHFKTINGRVQLREWTLHNSQGSGAKQTKPMNRLAWMAVCSSERDRFAKEYYLKKAAELHRILEKHDVQTKQPPPMCCAIVNCGEIFCSDLLYYQHEFEVHRDVIGPLLHSLDDLPETPQEMDVTNSIAKFHLMLQHAKGFEAIRNYLTRVDGLGSFMNCLEVWISIQDWKRVTVGDKNYNTRALMLYDTFLRHDAPRPTDLRFDGFEETLERLETFRNRNFEGFYRRTRAERSTIRFLLGVEGQPYQEWTEDGVLSPTIFQNIEWFALSRVFSKIARDPDFLDSFDYNNYAEVVRREQAARDEALLKDYTDYRFGEIKTWVQGFMKVEKAMSLKAFEVVDVFLEIELQRVVHELMFAEATVKTFEIRCKEQEVHEKAAAVVDEAVTWIEIDVAEYVFNFYVSRMLKTMWDDKDLRKGMLEYAGIIKPQLKRKMVVDKKARNNPLQNAWFDTFFSKALHEERKTFPLTYGEAAVRIQRMVRGLLGRNQARREFAVTFVKKYDANIGMCYFANLNTNETSWDRPKIMKYLFPRSNW